MKLRQVPLREARRLVVFPLGLSCATWLMGKGGVAATNRSVGSVGYRFSSKQGIPLFLALRRRVALIVRHLCWEI